MFSKDESKILKIINSTPLIIIILYTALVSFYLYYDYNQTLKKSSDSFTEYFIANEKKRIKNRNLRVHNYIKNKDIDSHIFLENNLKLKMQNIYQNIDGIYSTYKDKKSKKELIEIIKSTLRPVRFNEGRSYVSLANTEYRTILQPIAPHREGANHYNSQDTNGKFFTREIHDLAISKGEGFVEYFYYTLKDKKNSHKKLSFIKFYKKLGLIIVIGEYLDEYNKTTQEEVLNHFNKLVYENKEYVTIVSEDGDILAHKDPYKLGKNIYRMSDKPHLVKTFETVKNSLINNNGYSSYRQLNRPSTNLPSEKISHAVKYEPWNWIVVNGFYMEDANVKIEKNEKMLLNEYKEKTKNTLTIGIVFLFLLFYISYLFSTYLKKLFKNYKNKIDAYVITNTEQKKILENAQRITHIGNWELDLATQKALWSEEMLNIFEIKGKNVVFGPDYLKTIMHKEDIKCFTDSMKNAINNNAEHKCIYRIICDDGKIKWIDCRGNLNKNNTKVIGTIQDITELKEKDELLRVQSRHAAMGEMLSMIAHQWRQPISVISMEANNILLDIALDDFDKNQAKEHSKNILLSTEHLSKTIDDFRNFFKPDKLISSISISEILEETKNIIGKNLVNHDIDLVINNASSYKVNVYKRELMQVFINIINNAKDSLKETKDINRQITIDIFDDKENVVTQVCDNGGGISKEILPKIFEPYFSTKGEMTGTGLGLYMSKVIIK